MNYDNMKKAIIYSVLSLACLGAAAQSFDPIVAEVLANNPSLLAEKAAQRAEALVRVAENRLAPTEIGFGYKWQSVRGGETKMDIEVSQAFDWPGAYGARRKAAVRAEAARAASLAATERSLRIDASMLLCKIVDANLRSDMLRTIVNNLDSLHGSMHAMLAQRQITELDHRKVALEEVCMKQQLADAENSRVALLAELAALNGGTLPAGAADLCEYPAAELLAPERYLDVFVPEIAAPDMEAETITLDARAERMSLYPGFSLGYGFEREGPAYFHGFTLGITLPSYSAKPRAEAAQWQARALRLRARQAESDRRASISSDHAEAMRLQKLLDDYTYAFGKDYPELLKRSLLGGQLSYIDYFSELNFYLSARLDYLTQLLSYHSLLTRLDINREWNPAAEL